MLSFLEAVEQRAADAQALQEFNSLLNRICQLAPQLSPELLRGVSASLRALPPVAEAPSLESLDANCLQTISRQCGRALPAGSRDQRPVALVRLAQVSRLLRTQLSPLLTEEYRRHRRRKNGLTQTSNRLGARVSWGGLQLRRVRAAAHAYRHVAICQGGCERSLKVSQMFQLLNDDAVDERQSKLVCVGCARLRYRLPSAAGEGDDMRQRRAATEAFVDLGLPFFWRDELTDDYGEGGEAAAALRDALTASGYGFGEPPCSPPLGDADCTALCDMLVSGLGGRCLWIDLSNSAVGDAGMAALARGLPACLSLMHLNLNGTSAGDEGVAALAAALTPQPLSRLSRAARSLLPPQAASEDWREATGWRTSASASATRETVAVRCPQLRWLYLVLDALGDAGAIALAGALESCATPKLECLWCCGAFSEASEPGEAGPGFIALTGACDARASSRTPSGVPVTRLRLELEHGFAWGM